MATAGSAQSEDTQQDGADFVEAALGVIGVDPAGLDVDGLKLGIELCGMLRGVVSKAEAGFIAELALREGNFEAERTIRNRQGVSNRRAKRRTKTATTHAGSDAVGDALGAGEISDEHADTLADVEANHPGATKALLPKAKAQGVDRFRQTARDWEREQADDDGEDEATRRYRARKARCFTRPEDGMGVTIAELDPENHAQLVAALAYWVRRLQNQGNGPEAVSSQEADPDADAVLVELTSEQKLADALIAMAAASISGNGSAAGTAKMVVIANFDVLTRRLTGLLPDGTALTPETVRRLGCDADILPALFGTETQPLNIGRSTRTLTAGQRTTLVARDRQCRGCGAGHEFCQAHHIRHWSHGGATDIDNLVLLCTRCHHLVHEAGYTVHRSNPDESYSIVAPGHQRRPHHTERGPTKPRDRQAQRERQGATPPRTPPPQSSPQPTEAATKERHIPQRRQKARPANNTGNPVPESKSAVTHLAAAREAISNTLTDQPNLFSQPAGPPNAVSPDRAMKVSEPCA